MVLSTTTSITGNLSGEFPDGLTLTNAILTTALATGSAVKTGTTAADTVLLQAYDVNGTAYKTFATLTANDTPTFDLTAPSGGNLTINATSIGATTPGTVAASTLTTSSTASFGGNITFTTYALRSVGNALTAAGTNRATGLQLAKEVNNITTAAASTGVILPTGVIGMIITVFNGGANAVQVYANGSETIDGTAGSTGVALTNAKRANFYFTAASTWVSAQLGVVSA